MSKTPEELAEEYRDRLLQNGERMNVFETFLAGYEAAQAQVAETDNVTEPLADEEIDLQQEVEALNAYMSAAQRKIMALQFNVEFLLWLMKDSIGTNECKKRMDQVMDGFGRNEA